MAARGLWGAIGAVGATLVLCGALPGAQAQWDDYDYYSTEQRAATVVTNLWIGVFAVASTIFGILGMVVATQWPNPRVCCYRTPFSDLPSQVSRGCCSLYSLNVGFGIFWCLVFCIMAVAKDVPRIVACLCFALMHALVVLTFRAKFKRHGRPDYPAESEMTTSSSVAGPGPRPAVGIPMYNIPMSTVLVGGPAPAPYTAVAAAEGGAPAGSSGSSSMPPPPAAAAGAVPYTHMGPLGADGSCQPYGPGPYSPVPYYQPPMGGTAPMAHAPYPYSPYNYLPYTAHHTGGPAVDGLPYPMYYYPSSRPASTTPEPSGYGPSSQAALGTAAAAAGAEGGVVAATAAAAAGSSNTWNNGSGSSSRSPKQEESRSEAETAAAAAAGQLSGSPRHVQASTAAAAAPAMVARSPTAAAAEVGYQPPSPSAVAAGAPGLQSALQPAEHQGGFEQQRQ